MSDTGSTAPMVELRQVALAFEEKEVLKDVSFQVAPRERLVILGQSGGGKSTILRLLLGILTPTRGSVLFQGEEISRMNRRQLNRARQRIGMVYQYSALISSLSVRDNLALPLEELTDKPKAEIDELIAAKLELVGMADALNRMPAELSGGMKKRIGLARGIILDPELILYDEPTAGLDPVISSVIDELIIDLSEKIDATSIIVTHEMESAFKIATRMAMLYEGRIRLAAPPAEFRASDDAVVAQFIAGSTQGPITEGAPRVKIERSEIRTGLLVVITLAVFVAVLIYLGSPGVFVAQKTFHIYFDNVDALKPGAEVQLAGRKIGRVVRLYSPVPASQRPSPKMEAMVEVQVAAAASIYRQVKVRMAQPQMLGDSVIDFTDGEESSGLAPDGQSFLGERQGGLADLLPTVLEKLDPLLQKATGTMDSLQKTSDNLTKITGEGADLPAAFTEFRHVGANLTELSSDTGPLHKTLENLDALTGPQGKFSQAIDNLNAVTRGDGPLMKTLNNTERITSNLAKEKDIETTFRNFRQASERLNATMEKLGPQFSVIGENLAQASETVKKQPWRLIWPTTKKYPGEGEATPAPSAETVRGTGRKTPRR